jgi:hypothetical protein
MEKEKEGLKGYCWLKGKSQAEIAGPETDISVRESVQSVYLRPVQ